MTSTLPLPDDLCVCGYTYVAHQLGIVNTHPFKSAHGMCACGFPQSNPPHQHCDQDIQILQKVKTKIERIKEQHAQAMQDIKRWTEESQVCNCDECEDIKQQEAFARKFPSLKDKNYSSLKAQGRTFLLFMQDKIEENCVDKLTFKYANDISFQEGRESQREDLKKILDPLIHMIDRQHPYEGYYFEMSKRDAQDLKKQLEDAGI